MQAHSGKSIEVRLSGLTHCIAGQAFQPDAWRPIRLDACTHATGQNFVRPESLTGGVTREDGI